MMFKLLFAPIVGGVYTSQLVAQLQEQIAEKDQLLKQKDEQMGKIINEIAKLKTDRLKQWSNHST